MPNASKAPRYVVKPLFSFENVGATRYCVYDTVALARVSAKVNSRKAAQLAADFLNREEAK